MGETRGEGGLVAWLALIRLPGIGAIRGRALLEIFGTPQRLLEADEHAWREAGLPHTAREFLSSQSWVGTIEPDLQWLQGTDRHLITLADSFYPPLLREIADPPLAVFVHGDPTQLSQPQIAIVGSRNPTPGGERTAQDFAAYLCGAGLTVTSGLAIGIDAAAHRGALRAGGRTLAVAGTGLDRVYPAQHGELAAAIIENGGALISEFPVGTPPRADHFPRRNRIISGLSLGTLVVEANPQSGSLITARLAAEQGREVFAIPGSIHNPLARGCHALIRQGAKLVETGQDILEELPSGAHMPSPQAVATATGSADEQNPDTTSVLNSLGFEPITIDGVVARSGLTAERVSSMLVVLELQGKVVSGPGGVYSRMP